MVDGRGSGEVARRQTWTADTDLRGLDGRILDGRSVRSPSAVGPVAPSSYVGSRLCAGTPSIATASTGGATPAASTASTRRSTCRRPTVLASWSSSTPSGRHRIWRSNSAPSRCPPTGRRWRRPDPRRRPSRCRPTGTRCSASIGSPATARAVSSRSGPASWSSCEGDESDCEELIPTEDPYRFVFTGGRSAGEDALFLRDADRMVDAANSRVTPWSGWSRRFGRRPDPRRPRASTTIAWPSDQRVSVVRRTMTTAQRDLPGAHGSMVQARRCVQVRAHVPRPGAQHVPPTTAASWMVHTRLGGSQSPFASWKAHPNRSQPRWNGSEIRAMRMFCPSISR